MGLEADASPTVYVPFWQDAISGATFAVRTRAGTAPPTAAVRAAIAGVNDEVPIDSIRSMQSVVGDSVAARSFQATLMSVFGAIIDPVAALRAD